MRKVSLSIIFILSVLVSCARQDLADYPASPGNSADRPDSGDRDIAASIQETVDRVLKRCNDIRVAIKNRKPGPVFSSETVTVEVTVQTEAEKIMEEASKIDAGVEISNVDVEMGGLDTEWIDRGPSTPPLGHTEQVLPDAKALKRVYIYSQD